MNAISFAADDGVGATVGWALAVGWAVVVGCVVGVKEADADVWHATSTQAAKAINRRFIGSLA